MSTIEKAIHAAVATTSYIDDDKKHVMVSRVQLTHLEKLATARRGEVAEMCWAESCRWGHLAVDNLAAGVSFDDELRFMLGASFLDQHLSRELPGGRTMRISADGTVEFA